MFNNYFYKNNVIIIPSKYAGGYWFKYDVRARYLHIIALKSHSYNNEGNYDRFN